MRPCSYALVCSVLLVGGLGEAMADDLVTLETTFANPPREYTFGPLWVWNDDLSEAQIVSIYVEGKS